MSLPIRRPEPAHARQSRAHRRRHRRRLQIRQYRHHHHSRGQRRTGPAEHRNNDSKHADHRHDPARARSARWHVGRPAIGTATVPVPRSALLIRRHAHHNDHRFHRSPPAPRLRTCGLARTHLRHITLGITMEHGVCRKYVTCRWGTNDDIARRQRIDVG